MAYEFDGEKYEKASGHQKEWGAKLVSELSFRGDEHVLDLGCGDGGLTSKVAELVPCGRVLGIDASQGMIESAKKNHNAANLDFMLLDIDAISFEDKFDIIMSNAALHWVKDHAKLLENVYYALRQYGKARFNFAAAGNGATFCGAVRDVMDMPEYRHFFDSFIWPWYMPDPLEYRMLASDLHFSEIEVWGENADWNFPDSDAVIKWIDQPSIVPFIQFVEEKYRDGFRKNVIELMLERSAQPDGSYFETFRRINIFAAR